MTQPKFAPIERSDEVRASFELDAPRAWVAHRPGEYNHGARASAKIKGIPGPDQGYALRLARHIAGRLELEEGEHEDDVLAGAVAIALRRAAQFGRAPVLADLEVALGLFGFLGDAPPELRAQRKHVFSGLAHDYWAQREIAGAIPTSSLAMAPGGIKIALGRWKELIGSNLEP